MFQINLIFKDRLMNLILMKGLDGLIGFDADNFLRVSLSVALEVVKESNLKESLTHDQFYKKVAERVRAKTDVSEELFYHLSHSVHWTLFQTAHNGGYESPLKLVRLSPEGDSPFNVVIERELVEMDLKNLTDYAIKEYSNLIKERARKFRT